MKRGAIFFSSAVLLVLTLSRRPAETEVSTVKEIAPGVYFHEGDLAAKGHCNSGWVIFEDYVLVLDANFPAGAREVIPKIKAQTEKPIRFAFDTHHHGDHAYGNQVWVEQGATPVAHEGVVAEMKRYETGHYGGAPGRWEEAARQREDVRNSKLKPPSLLYRDLMIFDDGKHRVELRWFGVAHTRGDGFAWLPKERILFTGDACVNGPYNYMGDGDSAEWIDTLGEAQQLGARTIAPGHGPLADGKLLEEQKQFFLALRAEVEKRKARTAEEVQKEVEAIRSALLPRHARYIDVSPKALIPFEAQVAQVYKEMTGKEFPERAAIERAYRSHLAFHGVAAQ
jgi:glyoxylase-like metal-dependent hydrolase (beta-lactamase superfamily II)